MSHLSIHVSNYEIGVGPGVDGRAVVFYHFHEFVDETHLTNYALRVSDIKHIYAPYIEEWNAAKRKIAAIDETLQRKWREMELQAERA